VVTKASAQDRIGVKLPDGISLSVNIENLDQLPSMYVIRWIRSTDVRDWNMEVVYTIETISNDPREAMGCVTGESYGGQDKEVCMHSIAYGSVSIAEKGQKECLETLVEVTRARRKICWP
jgi:hypothetical protein